MRTLTLLIALVVVVTACKKAEKTEGAAAANPCDAAVAKGVDKTIAKRREGAAPMTPQEAEVPAKLKVALTKSCIDDKWSAEVIECFNSAPDMATCKEKLTPEQRAAYTRAAMGVMAGARGSSGMPAHGMGGAPMGGAPMGGSAAPPTGSDTPPTGSAAPAAGSGSN